jgi:hypothetical protein
MIVSHSGVAHRINAVEDGEGFGDGADELGDVSMSTNLFQRERLNASRTTVFRGGLALEEDGEAAVSTEDVRVAVAGERVLMAFAPPSAASGKGREQPRLKRRLAAHKLFDGFDVLVLDGLDMPRD